MQQLVFQQSLYWLLPAMAVSIGAGIWKYYRTPDPIPTLWKRILATLLGTCIFLIGFLLLEPTLLSRKKVVDRPYVAIVTDHSESMVATGDSSYLRGQYLKDLTKLQDAIGDLDGETGLFRLSDELQSLVSPDSIRYNGNGTALYQGLQQLRTIVDGRNLAGIVLVSDGISTSGPAPLYALQGLKVPVFTLLAGDTTLRKDLSVFEVLYNDIAYLHATTPLTLRVRSTGYTEPVKTTVTLSENGKVLDAIPVNISPSAETEVMFTITPEFTGLHSYSVSISGRQDEFTLRNNSRQVFIRVLENRAKIVLLAGMPHPDISALCQALGSDDRYELVSCIHSSPSQFYTAPTEALLASADAIILHNFPFSGADAGIVDQIVALCESKKIPLMVFFGNFTDLKSAKKLFPYTALVPGSISDASDEVLVQFQTAYAEHATYTFEDGWLGEMSSNPPVLRNRSDWKLTPESNSFGTATIKGVPTQYPVYALRSSKGRRNVTFIGEGWWRWRLENFVRHQNFNAYDDWICNQFEWMISKDDKRRFKVQPVKSLFSEQEPVRFTAQVYDESYKPMSGVEIKLTLTTAASKPTEFFFTEATGGQYSLRIPNLAPGSYQWTAEGNKNGKRIGSDAGAFSVGRSDIEFVNVRADAPMLRSMAAQSSGTFLPVREIGKLPELLRDSSGMVSISSFQDSRIPLLDMWWICVLLILMLGSEWAVRRWFNTW